MRKVAVARPGQTAWSAECRKQGHINNTLNAKGQIEAAELGKTLRSSPETLIELIATSDLVRATESAFITAQALGLKRDRVIIDARLREMSMGDLEGLTMNEIVKKHGQSVFKPPLELERFHGETQTSALERQKDAVRDVCAKVPEDPKLARVLFVGHGVALSVWLEDVTGEALRLTNGECRIVELP